MVFCKYKNFFGEPGKGIHSYRVFGIAIVDVIGTIIVSAIISYFSGFNFIHISIFLFCLGILLHRMFCVRTTVDKLLFPHAR